MVLHSLIFECEHENDVNLAMTYKYCTDQWALSDAEKSTLTSSLCNLSIFTV